MNKLKLFREELIIPLLIFFTLALSAIPNIYYFLTAPKDVFYTFAFNYIPDYNQYIAFMKDGADGNFLMTFRSSPDNFPKYPVYLFYLATGFIFGKLGIDLFFGFFVLRIIASFFLLFTIYQLLSILFSRSFPLRFLAFFLIIFSYPFYNLQPISFFYPSLTSIQPLARNLFLPHDSLGVALAIMAAIRYRQFVTTAILLIFIVILNPAMYAIFSFYFFLAGLVYFAVIKKNRVRLLAGGLILAAFSLPVFLYYQYIFTHIVPFSFHFAGQSGTNYHIGLKEYFIVSGPLILLALYLIFNQFLKRRIRIFCDLGCPKGGNPVETKKTDSSFNYLLILIFTWAFTPYILFQLLATIIPLSQERIFETFFHIPIGILAAFAINKIPIKQIKIAIIVIFILAAIPYYYQSMKQSLNELQPGFMNVFVPVSTVEAFRWLDNNSPDESVVAAGYFSGNLLPAFSHNRVVFGHDASTYRGRDRWQELMVIYSNESTPTEINDVVSRNKIQYILFTPDSIQYSQTNLSSLNNLKLVFANNGNSIYSLSK